ncbi:MAG: hypothetical protein H0U50_13840 [Pyrinomonadaceae bacterium]|nr:hypothetical protein [Pyrinomonadaceae bacterium]
MALIVALIGAVGSLGLMFNAGRNQKSFILPALFVIWDVSPFAGLFVADMFSKSLSPLTRVSLYCLMLVLTAVSLVAYSGVLNPPDTKNAFMFLVVPGASWLLMVTVIPIAALISRKRPQ